MRFQCRNRGWRQWHEYLLIEFKTDTSGHAFWLSNQWQVMIWQAKRSYNLSIKYELVMKMKIRENMNNITITQKYETSQKHQRISKTQKIRLSKNIGLCREVAENPRFATWSLFKMKDTGQGPIGIFLHHQEVPLSYLEWFFLQLHSVLQCNIYFSAHPIFLFQFFEQEAAF